MRPGSSAWQRQRQIEMSFMIPPADLIRSNFTVIRLLNIYFSRVTFRNLKDLNTQNCNYIPFENVNQGASGRILLK
jgi:hypothetical protein